MLNRERDRERERLVLREGFINGIAVSTCYLLQATNNRHLEAIHPSLQDLQPSKRSLIFCASALNKSAILSKHLALQIKNFGGSFLQFTRNLLLTDR